MSDSTTNSVIRHPGFINLWTNQILVQLAYNCLNFSLIIWVYQLTQSNSAVSILMFAIYLPAVLFGLIAGVLVDLLNRKLIFICVNFGLTLLFISLIIVKQYYFAILIVAFLVNTLSQFYTPAEASAIPLIVKKNQLLTANSLFSITLFLTFLVGFGLAGPIIDKLGINYAFGLGGLSLFIAFILAGFFPNLISTPNARAIHLKNALISINVSQILSEVLFQLHQTIILAKKDVSILVAIFIMSGIQVFIGIMAVLIPDFLEQIVRISATKASYFLVIPLGLGMVTGGFLLSKWGNSLAKRFIVSRAILLAGALFVIAGTAPSLSFVFSLTFLNKFPLVGILAFGSYVLGICLVSIMVPSQTVIQEKTPDGDRGKVFALLAVAMSAFSLIPVLVSGILADLIGTPRLLTILGSIIFLLGLFSLKPTLISKSNLLPDQLKGFFGLDQK